MANARRLQTHFFVCFSVKGEKLSPSRCNPLLIKFTKMLKDFSIDNKEGFTATVSVVDDFQFQEIDSRWIKCSNHLTFEIVDTSPSNDVALWALDDENRRNIHNKLRELSLSDGTYTHKMDIKVMDSYEGSSPPMVGRERSPWPKQRF